MFELFRSGIIEHSGTNYTVVNKTALDTTHIANNTHNIPHNTWTKNWYVRKFKIYHPTLQQLLQQIERQRLQTNNSSIHPMFVQVIHKIFDHNATRFLNKLIHQTKKMYCMEIPNIILEQNRTASLFSFEWSSHQQIGAAYQM